MEPQDPQFGKPRNSFEEVWAAIHGTDDLANRQRKQEADKAAEKKETDAKFDDIVKNINMDDK
jgi:hypothetical protein